MIGGTEQVSSEAHILYYDTRNPKTPAYSHASTHSDDITHLSLLPSTSTFLRTTSSSGGPPLPDRLLLSASTDGLVALSSMKETDEDEACLAAENWGQSIASAGSWMHKGTMKVWARSDMDAVATWSVSKGAEDELEVGQVLTKERIRANVLSTWLSCKTTSPIQQRRTSSDHSLYPKQDPTSLRLQQRRDRRRLKFSRTT